ncbi:MAG TPA: YadA-like family protein [Chakrabartia sp.]|nr:YadA-like family protein [Chakrabartia sp.]
MSGTGSQGQTTTSAITTTYNPGPPPTVVSTSAPVNTSTPVGTATVTAVSASGAVGLGALGPLYGSTLSTSGAVTNGAVAATEDSVIITSSGATYERRVGTATYDPTTGKVTVALPTAATSSTAISATGISTGALTSTSLTTGAISATGLNMNGNKITNVAAGTAATDAVNLGQLNSAVATLTGSYNTFTATVNANLLRYRKLAQAGTAVAVAMSGGTFLPDKKVNLTVNFGHFEGESAVSGQLGFLVSPNFALNAGVATSFTSGGGTAVRVGGTFGF